MDHARKIARMVVLHLSSQAADGAHDVTMALAKELCDLKACGGDGAVLNGKLGTSRYGSCGRTNGDVSHDGPVRQVFEPIASAAKQR